MDCDYRAHLLAECGDISVDFSAGVAGTVSGTVHLWRLEAVEHLPSAPSDMATSAARLREVCHNPTIDRVTAVLPGMNYICTAAEMALFSFRADNS